MPKKRHLIPPADYVHGDPPYLPAGTVIDHHVDGSSWGGLIINHNRTEGWFTSRFDDYYYFTEES